MGTIRPVAALAACAALAGALSMGASGATATASASPQHARADASASMRAALAHAAPVRQHLAGSVLATTCYTYGHTDPSGDTTGGIDVTQYGMSYDCVNHQWQFWMSTSAPFASSNLAIAEDDIDTDKNVSTGCDGFDYSIAMGWSTNANALVGAFFKYDNQCKVTFLKALPVTRAGSSSFAAVTSSASTIHETFEWAGLATGNPNATGKQLDYFPPSGAWIASPTQSTAFTPAAAPAVSGTYTRLVSGDFDGDGYSDIFWFGSGTLPDGLWFGGASGFTGKAASVNGTYSQVVSGDFDGDGRTDLLFYRAGTGQDYVWWGNADRTFTSTTTTINIAYKLVVGDYNGDHRDDLLLYAPGAGTDHLWFGQLDRSFVGGTISPIGGNYQIAAGDFNGDGYDDLLIYLPGTGQDALRLAQPAGGFTSVAETFNNPTAQLRTGDFNGDGRSDALFYSPDTATDAVAYGTTSGSYLTNGPLTIINEPFADIAVGDFNNDNADDLFAYGSGKFPELRWNGS